MLFAHGQLYAAFSRVTRTIGLTVLVNSDAIKFLNEDGTATVTNVVWPELSAHAPAQADPLLIAFFHNMLLSEDNDDNLAWESYEAQHNLDAFRLLWFCMIFEPCHCTETCKLPLKPHY